MNILFFLLPKANVAYAETSWTVRQAAEKLLAHNLTAIPVLNAEGQYIGTVSEGDLFRYIKEKKNLNYQEAENIPITEIPHEREVMPIRYDADMRNLVLLAGQESFVPVLDDEEHFLGIITRQSILKYLEQQLEEKKPEAK